MDFTERPPHLPYHVEINHTDSMGWYDYHLVSSMRSWCQEHAGECIQEWDLVHNKSRSHNIDYLVFFFKEPESAVMFKLMFSERVR